MKVKNGDFAAAVEAAQKSSKAAGRAPQQQSADTRAADVSGYWDKRFTAELPPGASRLYPPSQGSVTFSEQVPKSLAVRIALWACCLGFLLAAIALAVALWANLLSHQKVAAQTLMTLLLALAPLAAVFALTYVTRGRTISGYWVGTLAAIPGFANDHFLELTTVEPDQFPGTSNEVLARDDVPTPASGIPNSSEDRQIVVWEVAFKAKDRLADSAPEGDGERALLMFAREIELALGLPAGRVWVSHVEIQPVELPDKTVASHVVYSAVHLQRVRSLDTDRVCEAIVTAIDKVRSSYRAYYIP